MSAEDLELEVRETFYDSVVEMFELDLSVLPGFSDTDRYYFTNFVIPKAAIFPNVGDAFEAGEKVIWVKTDVAPGFVGPVQTVEYEPIPITATGFDRTTKGQIPQPELQVSNIFGTLSGLIASLDDLIGVKVYRRRTLAKYLGNFPTNDYTTYFPTDIYYIERKVAETNMSVTFQLASPLDLEGIQLPRRVITHNHCLWEYRGVECGYGGDPPRDSDLDGLPIANQFDEVPDSSSQQYKDFGSAEQGYLDALADYLAKKKIRDDAEAAKNLALGSKENACDDETSTSEYFYFFDSEDEEENLDADDATFALIREVDNVDTLVTIVFSGSTVTGDQYTFDASKKGRAGGEIADDSINVAVYEYNGVYEVEGSNITFAMIPQGVDEAYVFQNGVFSTEYAADITDNEDGERKVGDSAPFGLRQVEVVTEDDPGRCATASGVYDTALGEYTTAQGNFNSALTTLRNTWNGLTSTQQDNLRDNFDICGKRLISCQLRFGSANLPYGGFPGANLTRG